MRVAVALALGLVASVAHGIVVGIDMGNENMKVSWCLLADRAGAEPPLNC